MLWLWILAAETAYFIKGLCGFVNALVFTSISSFGVSNADSSPSDLLLAGSIPGALLLKTVDIKTVKLIFGVVVVLNLMIGQVTPPFGVCLFVISDVNKIKLERIYKSILPFLVPLLITLAVTCIFPQVVTFLPDMLLGATAA